MVWLQYTGTVGNFHVVVSLIRGHESGEISKGNYISIMAELSDAMNPKRKSFASYFSLILCFRMPQ